VKGKPKAQ
jgi:hypothetical protein